MLLSCTILGVPVSLTNVVNFDVGKERGRFFKLSSTLTSESELIDARYISGSRRGKLLARKNYQRDIVYGKTILGVKLPFFFKKRARYTQILVYRQGTRHTIKAPEQNHNKANEKRNASWNHPHNAQQNLKLLSTQFNYGNVQVIIRTPNWSEKHFR